jgi:hypothetical protein
VASSVYVQVVHLPDIQALQVLQGTLKLRCDEDGARIVQLHPVAYVLAKLKILATRGIQ